MTASHRVALGLGLLAFSACTTFRPCTEGGNLKGIPVIKGNRQCYQKKNREGKYINDGKFIQWHPNGVVAIEGAFKAGDKTGTWYFFDEKGKKTAEKNFENDIEMSGSTSKKE